MKTSALVSSILLCSTTLGELNPPNSTDNGSSLNLSVTDTSLLGRTDMEFRLILNDTVPDAKKGDLTDQLEFAKEAASCARAGEYVRFFWKPMMDADGVGRTDVCFEAASGFSEEFGCFVFCAGFPFSTAGQEEDEVAQKLAEFLKESPMVNLKWRRSPRGGHPNFAADHHYLVMQGYKWRMPPQFAAYG